MKTFLISNFLHKNLPMTIVHTSKEDLGVTLAGEHQQIGAIRAADLEPAIRRVVEAHGWSIRVRDAFEAYHAGKIVEVR